MNKNNNYDQYKSYLPQQKKSPAGLPNFHSLPQKEKPYPSKNLTAAQKSALSDYENATRAGPKAASLRQRADFYADTFDYQEGPPTRKNASQSPESIRNSYEFDLSNKRHMQPMSMNMEKLPGGKEKKKKGLKRFPIGSGSPGYGLGLTNDQRHSTQNSKSTLAVLKDDKMPYLDRKSLNGSQIVGPNRNAKPKGPVIAHAVKTRQGFIPG